MVEPGMVEEEQTVLFRTNSCLGIAAFLYNSGWFDYREIFYLKGAKTRVSSMDSLLEELKQALDTALNGMSSQQMGWHPEGKWCAAEVLEHLYLTYTGTIKGFERLLAGGAPITSPTTMTHRVRQFVVFGLNHMPEGRKAPKQALPRGLPADMVRADYGIKIAAMDEIIANCADRFGRKTKLLDHLILGPLTATQWRKFHLIHGQHHVKQILELRKRSA
jgi:hypothetical protein